MVEAVKDWVHANLELEEAKRDHAPRIKKLRSDMLETERALHDQLVAEGVDGCVRIGDRCYARLAEKKWQDAITPKVIRNAVDAVSDAHLLQPADMLEAAILRSITEARTKSKKVAVLALRAMGSEGRPSDRVAGLAKRITQLKAFVKDAKDAHDAAVQGPAAKVGMLEVPVKSWMAEQSIAAKEMKLTGGGGPPEVHVMELKTITRTPRVTQQLVCAAVGDAVASMVAEDAAERRNELVERILQRIKAVPPQCKEVLQFKKK